MSNVQHGLPHPDRGHLACYEDGKKEVPPTDRGKHAYLFLAACFVLEALIWGMYVDGDRDHLDQG